MADAAWLSLRGLPSLVAERLACAPEYAKLQIFNAIQEFRVKVRGRTAEGWPVSVLPITMCGALSGRLVR